MSYVEGELVLVHTQVPEAGESLKLGRRWKGLYKKEKKKTTQHNIQSKRKGKEPHSISSHSRATAKKI